MFKKSVASFAAAMFLSLGSVSVFSQDNFTPEVTARVVRISSLKGDAQVLRNGSAEWENAALNLPLAEGDEIVLSNSARMEIQFDANNYLRMGENGRVRMTTLKDEGVAVSVMSGSAILRLGRFDADKNFFEIDAPSTTIAAKAAGSYKVDAGNGRTDEVGISVGDGGEARIYSDQSGFTVRNGRGAILYLSGGRAGEWETLAADFSDGLSKWSIDRDESIAKKIKNSYFGKYYDYDQYGAEDLSDYGDWINTPQYGYVWRPYNNVTSYYRDWSPYRYGHWRWFSPYGWTWVNDEPWGWATYHHGRWIYLSGGWYWSPYASDRWNRSWWRPALVTIAFYGGRVYWYPIGYYSPYYDFNMGYYGGRGGRGGRDDNRGANIYPFPNGNRQGGSTSGTGSGNTNSFPTGGDRFKQKPIDRIPVVGVVAMDDKDFGRTRGGGRTAPPDVANQILNGEGSKEAWNTLPDSLPGGRRGGGDIVVDDSRVRQMGPPIRTGAGQRTTGGSMDSQLEKQVIFQDRTPSRKPPARGEGDPSNGSTTRGSGAVERSTTPPVGGRFEQKPVDRSGGGSNTSTDSKDTSPSSKPSWKYEPPVRSNPPERKYEPPVRSNPPERKYEPPVRSNPPERKYEPPVRSNPPERKYEPPSRGNPPSRSEPPKSSPPPSKSESPKGDGSTLQRKSPPKVPDDD